MCFLDRVIPELLRRTDDIPYFYSQQPVASALEPVGVRRRKRGCAG